jgi:hypothetical protein
MAVVALSVPRPVIFPAWGSRQAPGYAHARSPRVIFLPPRTGLGDFTAVANAIQTQENATKNYASLNNPGMLVYAGQASAKPVTMNGTTWASFPDYATGYQELLRQIALDSARGETISEFTAKYAPASAGNDPATYARNIAAAVGLSPSDLLSAADLPASGVTPAAGCFDLSGSPFPCPDVSSVDVTASIAPNMGVIAGLALAALVTVMVVTS